MELLLPFAAAVLIGAGVFLVLARALIRVILGLSMIAYGVNLSILLSGGLAEGAPPLLDIPGPYVDPLPQALILTAIVIGFGTTALLLVLSIRAYQATGTDEVQELTEKPDPPAIIEAYADPERPSISPERGPAEDRPGKRPAKKTALNKRAADPKKATSNKTASDTSTALKPKREAAETPVKAPGKRKKPAAKNEAAETSVKAKVPKKTKRKKPKAKDKDAEPSVKAKVPKKVRRKKPTKDAEPSVKAKNAAAKKPEDEGVKPPVKPVSAKNAPKNEAEPSSEALNSKDLNPKDLNPDNPEDKS